MTDPYDPTQEFEGLPDTTSTNLLARPHSWRNYEPAEFVAVAEREGKAEARSHLRRVEDGRFNKFLKYAHKFFGPLDEDEREEFARRNPDLVAWIGAYGYLEDLQPYPEYAGVTEGVT